MEIQSCRWRVRDKTQVTHENILLCNHIYNFILEGNLNYAERVSISPPPPRLLTPEGTTEGIAEKKIGLSLLLPQRSCYIRAPDPEELNIQVLAVKSKLLLYCSIGPHIIKFIQTGPNYPSGHGSTCVVEMNLILVTQVGGN